MTKQPLNIIDKDNQRAYWADHVRNWKQSKLKQKAYCMNAGISYNSFAYWKGILSSEFPAVNKKAFIPVKVTSSEVVKIQTSQDIQIKLATGHVVSIPSTMDPKQIASLIQLLGVPHA